MPTARRLDNPLDDDFGADEVSPYRRRPKAVPVRSKRWARFQWLLRCLAFTLFDRQQDEQSERQAAQQPLKSSPSLAAHGDGLRAPPVRRNLVSAEVVVERIVQSACRRHGQQIPDSAG